MTFTSFFQYLKSALEWAANSELFFIIFTSLVLIPVLCFNANLVYKFISDLFDRR